MSQQHSEHKNLEASLAGLRKTYLYWHSKPSSLVRTEICDLLEDAIEVLQNVIARHRTSEEVN